MRIAVVAGPAPGHAFPAIALALRLRLAGHQVLAVNGTQWQQPIERAGLPFVELPLIASSGSDDDFGFRMWGRPVEMAPPLVELLAAWRVELVVADTLTTVGSFAAGLLGVPWAELIPHPLQDVSVGLPAPGLGVRPATSRLGQRGEAYFRRRHLESRALADTQRIAARRRLGLPDDGPPIVRLVATLPALEVPRPDWPARTHVVGPLEWDPTEQVLEPPVGVQPLVFLSASTMSDVGPGLLETALAGFAGLGVRMASTRFAPFTAAIPPWAVVGPGRQDALLGQAAVVVSGAGHGIVAKALVRGLPLVVVAGQGEQRDNAERLCLTGAGLAVPPERLSPKRLAKAVRRVLADPSYPNAAASAARTVEAAQDPVGLLEQAMR